MLKQKNPFIEPIIQSITNDRYINDIISDYYEHGPNCGALETASGFYDKTANEYGHHSQNCVVCVDMNTNILCSELFLEKFIDGDKYVVLYDTSYCVNPWDKNSEREYSKITKECRFFVDGDYIRYIDVLSNMWVFNDCDEMLFYPKLKFLGFRDKIPVFEVKFGSYDDSFEDIH